MSALDSVLESLRRAYAAIGRVEEVAARVPGDRSVLANLVALKADAQDLERQWEEECRNQQVEICRYRIIPQEGERYNLASVTKSLLNFQELFAQLYAALTKGVRERARISGQVGAETAFDFGYSFPGSLGIALTIQGEARLFDSKYNSTIDAFVQLIAVRTTDDVKTIANSFGNAVIKKTYDWSQTNFFSGFGIDINWINAEGLHKGGTVGAGDLGRIAEIIKSTSDKTTETLHIRAILVAIDTVRKSFRLVQPDGGDYQGRVAEDFPFQSKWTVNVPYEAIVSVETVTHYATEKTENAFTLTSLKLFNPA